MLLFACQSCCLIFKSQFVGGVPPRAMRDRCVANRYRLRRSVSFLQCKFQFIEQLLK